MVDDSLLEITKGCSSTPPSLFDEILPKIFAKIL